MIQNPYNAQSSVLTTTGGQLAALNLQPGPNLVKAGAGRIFRISVITVGTAGTFAVYDAATIGAAATTNALYIGTNTTAAGTVVVLEFPYVNGLVVTVPTGGVLAVSYI